MPKQQTKSGKITEADFQETAEIRRLWKRFKNNDIHALYELGCVYRNGKGVSRNLDRAEGYFEGCVFMAEMIKLAKNRTFPNMALYKRSLEQVRQSKKFG
ncbi:MAG: SEL1-like repeat protein [Planctomycetaceae bacterium]|nr:SEL1-like repeat protein [Planctomycetaceae bacterium]